MSKQGVRIHGGKEWLVESAQRQIALRVTAYDGSSTIATQQYTCLPSLPPAQLRTPKTDSAVT